jgi:chromatin modification-related protein VID21
MQARAAQGQGVVQMAAQPNPAQVQQNAAAAAAHLGAAAAAAGRVNVPNQANVPGQARPRMPMQAPANAAAMGTMAHLPSGLVPPLPLNGIPQAAQLQAMQAQQRMAIANANPTTDLILQARRISEQQRQTVQMQQAQAQQQHPPQVQAQAQQQVPQQVPGQQASPPGIRTAVNGINQQNFLSNTQAMMASYSNAAAAGLSTPAAGGLHMPSVPAGSPRPQGAQPQLSAALLSQLNAVEAQLRQKHPNLTPEQLRQLAMEQLTRYMMAQRQNLSQSAMNAAAGAATQAALANGIPATGNSLQYAALLRQQQQAQQAAAAAAAAASAQNQQQVQQAQQVQHAQQAQQAQQQQAQQQVLQAQQAAQQAAAQQAAQQAQQATPQQVQQAAQKAAAAAAAQQQHQRSVSATATPPVGK